MFVEGGSVEKMPSLNPSRLVLQKRTLELDDGEEAGGDVSRRQVRSRPVKRTLEFDDDEGEGHRKWVKTSHLFPFVGVKRARPPSDEDEPVDPFAYEPRRKIANVRRSRV